MAQAKTDPTRPDDAAPKASSNWLLIIEEVFLQWRDRLGSSEDAGQKLVNLLCDRKTRSKICWVGSSGEEVPHTVCFPDIEFWRGRLVSVPDPDGGLDDLKVNYGDERLAFHDPDGHWEFNVRRLDVERWERRYPELASPPSTAAAPAVSEVASEDVSREAQDVDSDAGDRPTDINPSTVTTVHKRPRQPFKVMRVLEELRKLDGKGLVPDDLEHQPAEVERILKPHYRDASRRVIARAYKIFLTEPRAK